MSEQHENKQLVGFEAIAIGGDSSRISAAIFFLLCFVPVFSTVLFGAVDSMTWVLLSIIAAAIALLWLAESWRAKGLLFNTSSLQLPVIAIILIGLIQLLPIGPLISLDPYSTRLFVTHLVIDAAFFGACLTFINTESRLRKIVLLIVIFGAVMAFLGILQRLAYPESIYGLRTPNQAIPFGPFVNQHHFSAMMQMTAGVAFAQIFSKKLGNDKKILVAIAIVIMIVAALMTGSRGGMIAMIAVFAFVGVLNFATQKRSRESGADSAKIRPGLMVAAGAGAIIVLVSTVLYLGGGDSLLRGTGMTGAGDDISNGRLHFWAVAIRIFFEHPLLGAGLESFGVAFTRYDSWNGIYRVEQAHNEYLQMLADAGIAGFACIAGFIFLLFKKGLATITNAGNDLRRNAAIGSLAGCFGILIHSFFDFPLRTPSNTFFFLLLAAIATVSVRTSDETPRRRRRSSAPSPRSP